MSNLLEVLCTTSLPLGKAADVFSLSAIITFLKIEMPMTMAPMNRLRTVMISLFFMEWFRMKER